MEQPNSHMTNSVLTGEKALLKGELTHGTATIAKFNPDAPEFVPARMAQATRSYSDPARTLMKLEMGSDTEGTELKRLLLPKYDRCRESENNENPAIELAKSASDDIVNLASLFSTCSDAANCEDSDKCTCSIVRCALTSDKGSCSMVHCVDNCEEDIAKVNLSLEGRDATDPTFGLKMVHNADKPLPSFEAPYANAVRLWDIKPLDSYHIKLSEPPSVFTRLEALKERALALARKPLPPSHLDDPTNIAIPENEWRKVYEPYADELEDLIGHLSKPSALKYQCEIKLRQPEPPPFVCKPYNLKGIGKQDALQDGVSNLKKLGVIEEGTCTWRMGIFVVPQKVSQREIEERKRKKEWTQNFRVVCDLQPLNAALESPEFPLPLIPDLLQMTQGRPILSLLDLRKAFYHVDIPERCRHYLGISLPDSSMRWKKLVMGVKSGPSIFQRNLECCVLKPVTEGYRARISEMNRSDESNAHVVMGYIDDIIVATKNKADHLVALDCLFAQLKKMRLTISINKCFLGRKQVHILGSTVSGHEIHVQQQRIRALQEIIPPRSIHELRGWIGGLRYLSSHVPDLSLILANFDSLTGNIPASKSKTTPVLWTNQLVDDYCKAQEAYVNPSRLFHIKPDLPLFVETDASTIGFGGVLFQTEINKQPPLASKDEVYPIAYFSRKWDSDAQQNYNACTKELRGLRDCIMKWSSYLLGMPFTVITDNQGVFGLIKRATEKAAPPCKNILHKRWLNDICLHNITRVIHLTTDQVFTSDSLSRSVWMEMAAAENEPGVWPRVDDVTPRTNLVVEHNKVVDGIPISANDITHSVVRHFRHHECPHAVDGRHPWHDIQNVVHRDLGGPRVTQGRLQAILRNCQRTFMNAYGAGAVAGHSIGQSPPYTPLLASSPITILYHATGNRKLPLIKATGLRRMKRGYVHLSRERRAPRRGRNRTVTVDVIEARKLGLTFYQTKHPDVFLCEGPIPPSALKFEPNPVRDRKRRRPLAFSLPVVNVLS